MMKRWPFANQPSSVTPWVMTAERIKLLDTGVALESPTLIIPRKFLFYQCIDLTEVPRAHRQAILQQRIRQLSPFSQPASWLTEESHQAQVWFWDGARVASMHEQQDLPTLQVIPEIMLYPPMAEGLRIQPCIEGWDLQYWANHTLTHSRWIPQPPSPRDKADFVRLCALDDTADWQLAAVELLTKPWNEKPFWSKDNLTSEAIAPKLVLGVLLVGLCLQLGLGLGVQIREKMLSISVSSKTHKLIETVRQRDNALQQQEFNQAIANLSAAPSQLHLLAQVRRCLSESTYSILDWQYQRGQLTLLLQQDNLDTRALLEACSKDKTFRDVHAEPGITPNQTSLVFSLPVEQVDGGQDAQ